MHGPHGGCILGIHLDIPRVVVAQPQVCPHLGHRLGLLPVLNCGYHSRYWLPLPIANYVAGRDYIASPDGGILTAVRKFVPNQQLKHSGDVALMCLKQLIIAHAGVP